MVSAVLLHRPSLSIVVSPSSDADARAVSSGRIELVHNGIDDPCPEFEEKMVAARRARSEQLRTAERPEIRVLFLSHGTVAKGLVDALAALESAAKRMSGTGCISVTFAGGVAPDLEPRFQSEIDRINADEELALRARTFGFIIGDEKARCFAEADLFLAPSRWESFGLTVVEAMAWGLPVVAASSDGVRGVLSDTYDWFAPPGEVERLAEVLERGLREVAGGGGFDWGRGLRARFEQRFGSDDFRTEIHRVLATHCGSAAGKDRKESG
jgi:glycosyltransferase involved in cell wall biosynthesis